MALPSNFGNNKDILTIFGTNIIKTMQSVMLEKLSAISTFQAKV